MDAYSEIEKKDLDADYLAIIDRVERVDLSDSREIRSLVCDMVTLSNLALTQKLVKDGYCLDSPRVLDDMRFVYLSRVCSDIEHLSPINPFRYPHDRDSILFGLRRKSLEHDIDFTEALATILVNFAATSGMSAEFGAGINIMRKSEDQLLRKRARKMYNRFALEGLRIPGLFD